MTRKEKQSLYRSQLEEKKFAKEKRCVLLSELIPCCMDCEDNKVFPTAFGTGDTDYERWFCSKKCRKDITVNRDFFSKEVLDAHVFGNHCSTDLSTKCDFLGIILINQ